MPAVPVGELKSAPRPRDVIPVTALVLQGEVTPAYGRQASGLP